jgi:hypothetical protein
VLGGPKWSSSNPSLISVSSPGLVTRVGSQAGSVTIKAWRSIAPATVGTIKVFNDA